jgi:hypothetical protein
MVDVRQSGSGSAVSHGYSRVLARHLPGPLLLQLTRPTIPVIRSHTKRQVGSCFRSLAPCVEQRVLPSACG